MKNKINQVPERVVARETCSIEFKFKNPLKIALSNCTMQYEGPHVLTQNVTLDL
jgi:hypothetical protein